MPNQRKRGKQLVIAWLPEPKRDKFRAAAKRRGLCDSTLLEQLIDAQIEAERPGPGPSVY